MYLILVADLCCCSGLSDFLQAIPVPSAFSIISVKYRKGAETEQAEHKCNACQSAAFRVVMKLVLIVLWLFHLTSQFSGWIGSAVSCAGRAAESELCFNKSLW